MKTAVVFLGIIGVAVCYPWGIPQQVHDTPEVAAAKAAHLAAHSKTRHSGGNPSWGAQERSWDGPEDDGSWTENKYDAHDVGSQRGSQGGSWQGNSDGSWRGKDEEGSRRGGNHGEDGSYHDDGSWRNYDDGSYREEYNSESGSGSWNYGSGHWDNHHDRKWTGPVALPPGYDKNGAPLQVLDTPEVAAAKAAHLAAHGRHY